MKRLVMVLALAGCNQAAQPEAPDAAVDAPASQSPHAMIVQQVATGSLTGDSATIALAPTQAGNSVFVIAGFEAASPTWMHAVTLGDAPLSPDSGRIAIPCGRTFELWSARDVAAGATSMKLVLDGPATFQAVAFEVSGLSRFPIYRSQNYLGSSAITPTPPVIDAQTYTDAGELVIGTVMTCGTLTGLADTGFAPVPLTTGTEGAVVVAAGAGMFGPHWIFDGTDWYEMTISYR